MMSCFFFFNLAFLFSTPFEIFTFTFKMCWYLFFFHHLTLTINTSTYFQKLLRYMAALKKTNYRTIELPSVSPTNLILPQIALRIFSICRVTRKSLLFWILHLKIQWISSKIIRRKNQTLPASDHDTCINTVWTPHV